MNEPKENEIEEEVVDNGWNDEYDNIHGDLIIW